MWGDPLSGGWRPRKGRNLPLPHVSEGLRVLGRGAGFSSGQQFVVDAGPTRSVQVIGHSGPRLLRQMRNASLYVRGR